MTAAWRHALRRSRARQGLCPECGGKITQGYGLMGGSIGAYEVCLNRRCPDPHFEKWPDPEMEGPAPEADCTAASASADVTVQSPSAEEEEMRERAAHAAERIYGRGYLADAIRSLPLTPEEPT